MWQRGTAGGPQAPFLCHEAKIKAGDTGAAGLLVDGGAQRHQQPSPTKATTCSSFSSLPHFLSTMSWPTGVIRNSKFSKQFSVFSVYMLGFIMVHGQNRFSTSRTLKLVRFLSLASLCSVGPTQTAALRCSVQPYHDRTPHPCRCHG